jgi:hypothetical protein
VQNPRVTILTLGAIAALVVGAGWYLRQGGETEVSSVATPSAGHNGVVVSPSTTPAPANHTPTVASTGSDDLPPSDSIGSGGAYPVVLDALRAELPDNRYWTHGAPTSDPEVAKARAARAERDNATFGRIQANEATPAEIRAYYAERRALSRDYLRLAEHVLDRQGAALPARDRGMFELSANLHRARLQQIDRDEADAVVRRTAR